MNSGTRWTWLRGQAGSGCEARDVTGTHFFCNGMILTAVPCHDPAFGPAPANGSSTLLCIHDASGSGEARRAAVSMATRLGFSEVDRAEVAIVITEAATNIIKHAGRGELVLRSVERHGVAGIEVLAIDSGPGIANLSAAQADGYSTAASPGHGLGAMARLADLWEIDSRPGVGTVVLARLWPRSAPTPELELPAHGVVCLPKPGEEISGDAWALQPTPHGCRVLVADGLGHGPTAAEASHGAVDTFHEQPDLPPVEFLQAAHLALRGTRGAALAIVEIDNQRETLQFAGVGNIAGVLLSADAAGGLVHKSLISHNGTVGHRLVKVAAFEHACPAGALLVLHSDGLHSRWRIEDYPGLFAQHPGLVAGVLYRDCHRDRDDATVLALRNTAGISSGAGTGP